MAISLTYGPISAALNLARQAGESTGVLTRQNLGQQALRNLDVRTSQALQLRGLVESRRRTDISTALAYQRLAADERKSQAVLAQRQAEMNAKAALARQQSAEQASTKEDFTEKFGVRPEFYSAQMQQNREARLVSQGAQSQEVKQNRAEELATYRKLQAARKEADDARRALEREQKQIDARIEQITDPVSRKLDAPEDYAASDPSHAAELNRLKGQSRHVWDQLVKLHFATAAQQSEGQSATPQEIEQLSGMIANTSPELLTIPPEQVPAIVAAKLGFFQVTDPAVIDAVSRRILSMRGQ